MNGDPRSALDSSREPVPPWQPGEEPSEIKRRQLNERLGAFLTGAEAKSRAHLGRGLTRDELERILRRYPGDIERR